jgi:thiol-disulfide isomerase/thioredoxin
MVSFKRDDIIMALFYYLLQTYAVVIDVSGLSDFNERKGSAPGLVVVDFSASWCGPCRMIKPKYEELSEKYNGVLFLCVMEGPANTEIIRSAGIIVYLFTELKFFRLKSLFCKIPSRQAFEHFPPFNSLIKEIKLMKFKVQMRTLLRPRLFGTKFPPRLSPRFLARGTPCRVALMS